MSKAKEGDLATKYEIAFSLVYTSPPRRYRTPKNRGSTSPQRALDAPRCGLVGLLLAYF